MLSNAVIFLLIVLLSSSVYSKSLLIGDAGSNITVQVYYETLCPDSIAFIKNQLFPTYPVLGKFIDLELLPWGHASENTVNGTKNFICQHGPKECYGNKVHACVLDLVPIQISAQFIHCAESATDPTDEASFKNCAHDSNITWSNIQECLENGHGDDLLIEYGKKTDELHPTFIPTIVLNGKFDQKYQNEALVDLKELICSLIGFPSQCKC